MTIYFFEKKDDNGGKKNPPPIEMSKRLNNFLVFLKLKIPHNLPLFERTI